MANGLRCWDASGNLTLDVTDRLTRFLGSLSTGTAAGSASIAGFSTGTPWIHVLDSVNPSAATTQAPSVSISGTTISWSYASTTLAKRAVTVLYGVY
ncbi:hypothetical protein OVY01_00105 [Robbsia sp. Bb-Pol-6]|uniref:Uncharacterized protein n=1 Tax=Robbsia betulipollinis TaxID=2981849 RepID=A0ABT3ZH38_9BURK|nr:hypothetical protein [Robbsia betulipollinis]MCY0385667.1 hypothetical protein [Robbsia betulipollinis]